MKAEQEQCGHGNAKGYCAECGKSAVITCQRCDGQGEIDADEQGMVKCPVCDGEATIDYAMVAEYAQQIDILRAKLLRLETQLYSGGTGRGEV